MEKLVHFKPSLVTKHFFHYEIKWPAEINRGRCFQWAWFANCMFDGIALCDTDSLNSTIGSHAFVKYRNRYYDSETLCGVNDFADLSALVYTSKKLVIHTPESFMYDWSSQEYRFGLSWDDMKELARIVVRSILQEEKDHENQTH